MLQVSCIPSPLLSYRSLSPPLSPSMQYRHTRPTLLQRPPVTDPKMWPSCGLTRRSLDRCGKVVAVSQSKFVALRPAHTMVSLMPVGRTQSEKAVLEQSWKDTEQQPVSTTPLPSWREAVNQTCPAQPLRWRPPIPCSKNVVKKEEEMPSKEDGIMADTLQDLRFLEKLLSSNLEQGDMGNSEVHRTLFKSLVHLKKILTLAPEVGNTPSPSWKPV